jgi:allantoin racemase
MRLLLVNPNMTDAMTDRMASIARGLAGSRAEIVPLTAGRGFPYIASRAEAQIGGHIALEMIAEHAAGADAAIIAAFGDPGLTAARELFDMPVIGMAEAAVQAAACLGDRFAVVTFSPLMDRWYRDCVNATGLGARCCGVRSPQARAINLAHLRDDSRADLITLARKAAEEDGADVIILGGAPLAGMAAEIATEVPALIIDPIAAATAQAMALVSLTRRADYAQRLSRPAGKPSSGLTASLQSLIAGEMHP